MNNYVCSNCGASCYYDGRCGDGPVLQCDCRNRGRWVDEGSRGGYFQTDNNARPVEGGRTGKNWSRDDD
jgi:hypothetical protein